MDLTILIADDSAIMRKMIQRTLWLSRLPISIVLMAKDGQEYLKVLDENWVDLLFLDINMPILGGLGVLKQLAQDHALKDALVIVVSPGSDRDLAQAASSGCVRTFVEKSFTAKGFKNAAFEALGESINLG